MLTDFSIDTSGTPLEMQRRQKLADALMQAGSSGTPIQSYTQGLNRLAQGLVGGYQSGQLAQEEKANRQTDQSLLSSYPGVSSPVQAATPMGNALLGKDIGAVVPNDDNAIPGTVGMNQRLADASQDFMQDNPSTYMSSGVRSNADQARLYADRANNPNPVAPPGTSLHERGLAVDIGGMTPDQRAMLPQYGLAQPVANDPPHVQLANAPDQGQQPIQMAQADPQAAQRQALAVWAQRAAMSNNPSIRQMGLQTLQQINKPHDSYSQVKDEDGNVWNINNLTGQRTVALKSDSDPKWGIVGKDKYGQPVYGYPPSREDYAAKASATPVPADNQPDLTDVHGEEYMSTLKKSDPRMESQVRAIIEGRAPYPTGMLLKTPYGQELASNVTQADPSFEAGNATARVKVRNEFKAGGVGSPAGQISAGNTAIQHAGEMSDALERMKAPDNEGVLGKVGESGIPFLSYYANKAHNAAVQGTPEGKAYNDFMTAKNHFSEEVTKFYAGSAGSEAERARALANLDAAKSLPELRSAIKTEANLMQGKVNALQERWRNGMGPLVQDFPLISKESQDAINRVMQRDQDSQASANVAAPSSQPMSAPQEGATATNPTTGERLIFKGGKWTPFT